MILHNVMDRRQGWIGPWEIEDEPLNLEALQLSDIGRPVIYRDYGRAELGVLSSFSAVWVFARFHTGDTAEACRDSDLHFAVRDASADFGYQPVGRGPAQ